MAPRIDLPEPQQPDAPASENTPASDPAWLPNNSAGAGAGSRSDLPSSGTLPSSSSSSRPLRPLQQRGLSSLSSPRASPPPPSVPGFTAVPVAPDGNCMFAAFSHQCYGSPEHAPLLRRTACAYIEQNGGFFAAFHPDLPSFVGRMSRDGCWGDNLTLQALTEIYQVTVEVYGRASGVGRSGAARGAQRRAKRRGGARP